MLVNPFFVTNNFELNKLVEKEIETSEDFFYHLVGWYTYEQNYIEKDTWSGMSRISTNECGVILGYFGCNYSFLKKQINGCNFVKFKNNFSSEKDHDIFKEDINKFFLDLLKDKRFNNVFFESIYDNKANREGKMYFNWLNRYGGESSLIKEYAVDLKGNIRDVFIYRFESLHRKV